MNKLVGETTRAKLPLHDFLECFTPPQVGHINDGFDPTVSGFDLPRGCALQFRRKVSPNVTLLFEDPWGGGGGGDGGGVQVKLTVPVEFSGRFRILPYDPVTNDASVDHIFETAEDLAAAFPVYAQANASYGGGPDDDDDDDDNDDDKPCFKCGDRLKLIRLLYDRGEKVLECRPINGCRLLRLPMHCKGLFTVVPDNNAYLLADLLALPLRKRRVQLLGKNTTLPGLPVDFDADLFLNVPEYFVEVNPCDEPYSITGLPHDLAMNVTPDDMAFERGHLLHNFATNNSNLFPLVARISDWDEETTILDNHYIRPGIELVIHGWTRQSKILAKAKDRYYAIPLTYQGRFKIKPQQFVGVTELERAHPAYKVKVIEVTSPADKQTADECPVSVGDVLRIRREDSMKKHAKVVDPNEPRHLKCEKYDAKGRHKVKDVKLPMFLLARFEELVDDAKASVFSPRELVGFLEDQALNVELVCATVDQKHPDRDLPVGGTDPITLCELIVEPAVYVSVETPEAPAFHVPLRTLIYVTFVEQLEKSSSPLLTKQSPKLSTLDRCVEILPEEVYLALGVSKQGGLNDFPKFKGATAFAAPKAGWQSEGHRTEEPATQGMATALSNGGLGNAFATLQHTKTSHHNNGTENLLQTNTQFASLPRPAARSQFDEFSFGPQQNGGSPEHRTHVAVAQSKGGQLETDFGSLRINQRNLSASTENVSSGAELNSSSKKRILYSSQPNLLHNHSLSTATHSGFSIVHQSQPSPPQPQPQVPTSPSSFQVPPGYALVPLQQAPPQQTVPPGYMLVPYGQSQQPLTMANVQQMTGTSVRSAKFSRRGSFTSESDDDAMTDISRFTFSSKAFKVVIPSDGNLYHFSTKKMAELFRQLKIDEPCIRACLRDRIDGKKFSKMMEGDLERYGLIHPVVLHFRRSTMKKRSHFML